MTVGDRIRKRRQDLDMTVEELAAILGKNRATIYRYEKGDIKNMPTPVLEPLAEALKTTPEYLMGWTKDPHDWDRIGNEMGIYPPKGYDGKYADWVKFKYYEESEALVDSYFDTYEAAKNYMESLNCIIHDTENSEEIIIEMPNGLQLRANMNDIVNNYMILGSTKPGIKKLIAPHQRQQMLRSDEEELLCSYNKLNSGGQAEARKRVSELVMIPMYSNQDRASQQNNLLAAHRRTDKESTPEGLQHDLDIMMNDEEWE